MYYMNVALLYIVDVYNIIFSVRPLVIPPRRIRRRRHDDRLSSGACEKLL